MIFEEEIIGICCVIVLVFGIGFAVGCAYTNKSNQQDLIKRGLAEWVADKEGNVAFKFKEAKP